ncbi:PAS domain-containing protein [Halosegnis longus]|nr:PAS domain-containing sensor histidine kinase [Salella cibi]
MSDTPRSVDGRDESGDRFRNLFANLPGAALEVVWRDGEYHIVDVNEAFESVFGYDGDNVLDSPLAEWLSSEDTQDFDDNRARVREGEVVTETVERETADGPRTFQASGIPLFDGDRALIVYFDVSEDERRERYQRVLTRVLRHTLRNEMNAISAHAETIAARTDDDTVAEAATTIHETALDVARLDEKARVAESELSATPESETIDAARLLREVYHEMGRTHGLAVQNELPETLPVESDGKLQRVFSNVFESAAERDADCVEVTHDRLRDEYVAVRIHDDGNTLPPQVKQVLSDETELSQLTHGDGLGLWIAKWIVEGRGGSLYFEDERVCIELRPALTDRESPS